MVNTNGGGSRGGGGKGHKGQSHQSILTQATVYRLLVCILTDFSHLQTQTHADVECIYHLVLISVVSHLYNKL